MLRVETADTGMDKGGVVSISMNAGALAPGTLSFADSSSKEGFREETAFARAVWPQLSLRRKLPDGSDASIGRNGPTDHPKSTWILDRVSVTACAWAIRRMGAIIMLWCRNAWTDDRIRFVWWVHRY